ncbi:serine--tRNA ligase [Candidatus Roizmanbacteria bacterium]|nr:serine--tRNA ligase [Candidatus Roizmanbacteria bacterium]
MLSIDFIRENKQKVVEAIKNKNRVADVDEILRLDDERKEHIQKSQTIREERNRLAKAGFTPENVERGKKLKDELKEIEDKLLITETELNKLLSFVPNVPLNEVPVGKDDTNNVEIRKNGDVPQFSFTPKSHIELATALDIVDLERGVKVSGYRGYFLKNEGALLNMALMMYVMQKLVKKGYTPFIAPAIVKGFTLFGTGQFPWGEPEVYKLNDDDAYLAGTAEVAITSYHANEVLKESELPKKFVAFSPCYRKEIGSYGKDTKGLYRVHEFWKIEQVILGENDLPKARQIHEELQRNCEEILQDLKLPYHVLLMCTGDMGEPQMIKYDTETWMPSRNGYGETMSNSIMGDFQTRRLNIRYKTTSGEMKYCYSFNNTALASPRILVAILENYQQVDGSVKVPEVLIPLTGFDTIKTKSSK